MIGDAVAGSQSAALGRVELVGRRRWAGVGVVEGSRSVAEVVGTEEVVGRPSFAGLGREGGQS